MKRVTLHRGRKHEDTGKIFSPLHNDRNLNPESVKTDSHINGLLSNINPLWNHKDGIYTKGTQVSTFDTVEKDFYDDTFQGYKKRRNGMDLRADENMAPEEIIIQVGVVGNSISPLELVEGVDRFISITEAESVQPSKKDPTKSIQHIQVLNWALHVDEPNAAPHVHIRQVYVGEKAYAGKRDRSRATERARKEIVKESEAAGIKPPPATKRDVFELVPSQTLALEAMGYQVDSPTRFENAKKQYSAHTREMLIGIVKQITQEKLDLTKNELGVGKVLPVLKRDTAEAEQELVEVQQEISYAKDALVFVQEQALSAESDVNELRQDKEAKTQELEEVQQDISYVKEIFANIQQDKDEEELKLRKLKEEKEAEELKIKQLKQDRQYAADLLSRILQDKEAAELSFKQTRQDKEEEETKLLKLTQDKEVEKAKALKFEKMRELEEAKLRDHRWFIFEETKDFIAKVDPVKNPLLDSFNKKGSMMGKVILSSEEHTEIKGIVEQSSSIVIGREKELSSLRNRVAQKETSLEQIIADSVKSKIEIEREAIRKNFESKYKESIEATETKLAKLAEQLEVAEYTISKGGDGFKALHKHFKTKGIPKSNADIER